VGVIILSGSCFYGLRGLYHLHVQHLEERLAQN